MGTLPGTAKTMPHNSNTARRDDCRILEKVKGISYREASQLLDGSRGLNKAQHGAAVVREIRNAARRQQAATGEPFQIALEQVLRQPKNLRDSWFSLLHPADLPWSVLFGMQVRFEPSSGNVHQCCTGVVLPPVQGPKTRPRLRVALTEPSPAYPAGEVVTLEVRRWSMDPMPSEADTMASRRMRCSAGRPIYEAQNVPAHVLATETTLRLRRLRPAVLQGPIATKRTAPGRVAPLYAIVDAEPIPPISIRQSAAIQRSRTCAECSVTSPEPFRAARDSKRYCDDHFDAAQRRVDLAERARNRAVSTVWAREVLEDPATVLAVMRQDDEEYQFHVEDVAGTVLLDAQLPTYQIPNTADVLLARVNRDYIPKWPSSLEVSDILGRRLLVAGSDAAVAAFTRLLEVAADVRVNHRFWPTIRDSLHVRRRLWTGEIKEVDRHDDFTKSLFLNLISI